MRKRTGALQRAVTVVAALASLGSALVAGPAAADPGEGPYSTLVMGDSYSAGNGAGEHYGAKDCYRSRNNYGELFARSLGVRTSRRTSVRTVACSGAETRAFWERYKGQAPQIDAADDSYDVIFLTIGGNDLRFAEIVQQCLVQATDQAEKCERLLTDAQRMFDDGTLRRRVRDVVADVGRRAHRSARVVLIGYPYLERDEGYTMTKHDGQELPVGRLVRALSRQGDDLERAVIDDLNQGRAPRPYVYVSTLGMFAGPPSHEPQAAGNNPDRWFVEPGDSHIIPSLYHPNPRGWWEESELLYRDVRIPKVDIHSWPDWESAT